jgi:hypothetical protein
VSPKSMRASGIENEPAIAFDGAARCKRIRPVVSKTARARPAVPMKLPVPCGENR